MEGGHGTAMSAMLVPSHGSWAFIHQLSVSPHPLVFARRSLVSGGGHSAAGHSRNCMNSITDTA